MAGDIIVYFEEMTRDQLIKELIDARQLINELEKTNADNNTIEEALKESEERYRRITSAITDYIFTVEVEDGIAVRTLHTAVCEPVTGYTAEELENDPFLWFNMVVEEDQEIVRDHASRILKGENIGRIEHRIRRKDGSVRWVSNTPVLHQDLWGNLISYDGVIRDITERKQSEEALKESEKRLQIILHGSPIATFVIDKDHRVISWNEALEHLSGMKTSDMVGTCDHWKAFYDIQRPCLADLIVDGAIETIHEWYPNKFSKSPLINEAYEATDLFPSLGEKGTWLRFTAAAIRNSSGDLVGAIETLENITKRKQVEEELQKLASLVRYSSEFVNLSNLDGKMIFLNEAGIAMLGIHPEEVEQVNILQVIPDHLQERVQGELLPALMAGGTWEGDLQYRNLKTGKLTDVHAVTFTITDAGTGAPLFLANVSLDITERKRAEDERKKLETQLVQSHKMEALGTLAGGIAHDFNNILSAIIAYTERGMQNASEPDKVRKNIDDVLKVTNRAKDLVKQILAFSRRTKHEFVQLKLDAAIKEPLKMLRALLPKTIEIRQNFLASGRVMADSTQIHQVVMNLCSNAAQAMDEKGGVLEVSLNKVDIQEDTDALALDLPHGSYFRLSISDTGHGMTPEVLERIFDPYFTTKEKGRGTGLGLSVVHGIVKSHKGAITCKSMPGQGTTFEIYLPEIEFKKEAMTSRTGTPSLNGSERILFIDDEQILVKATKERLRYLGYRVVTRTSSVDALDLFQKHPEQFDLVITDIIMPVMTGDKLALEFMKIRPDIPIILCTGYSEHMNEEKAKELGVREFLMKPFEIEDLAKSIRKVLDGK
jgi:two-component system, cell cycle sensor histidine kinase and response regulator CckA